MTLYTLKANTGALIMIAPLSIITQFLGLRSEAVRRVLNEDTCRLHRNSANWPWPYVETALYKRELDLVS